MSGGRGLYPLTRLAIALGFAARNIADPNCRALAARDADKIPKCRAEIGGGRRGQMAREGRALLAQLTSLAPDELADAALRLRAYADAVGSSFQITSETSLGDRKKQA